MAECFIHWSLQSGKWSGCDGLWSRLVCLSVSYIGACKVENGVDVMGYGVDWCG